MKRHLANLPDGLQLRESKLKSAFEKATPQSVSSATKQTNLLAQKSASASLRPKKPSLIGRMFGASRTTTRPTGQFSGSAGVNNPNTLSPSKPNLTNTKLPGAK